MDYGENRRNHFLATNKEIDIFVNQNFVSA